jgi:uncharacterized repeat protein (TIGR01451 family)
MKKKITSRTLRALATVVTVIMLSNLQMLAQGFLRNYPAPQPSNGNEVNARLFQFFETPQGYTIQGTLQSNYAPDSMRYYSVRHTDLNGIETQAVELFDYDVLPYGYSGSNEDAVVTGTSQDSSHILLAKNDINGTLLWQKSVEIPGYMLGGVSDTRVNEAGEIFVALLTFPATGPIFTHNSTLAKLDANGNLLWTATELNGYLDGIYSSGETLTPAADGGCYMHYGEHEYYKMVKVSNDGDILWRDSFSVSFTAAFLLLPKFSETAGGGIVMTAFPGAYSPSFIKHWDSQGTLVWNAWNLATIMGGTFNFYTGCLVPSNDGGIVIIGQGFSQQGSGLYASKFTADGTQIWQKRYQDFDYQPYSNFTIAGGKQTADGGYLFAGTIGENNILLKIDGNGNLHSNLTIGTVAGDMDNDCLVGPADAVLPNTVLQATGNGSTLWAISDANGHFEFQADTGSYSIHIQPLGYPWEPCFDSLNVTFPDTGMVQTADFPMQAIAECPLMTVDLVAPRLRRCFENYVAVNYCNLGSIPAVGAEVNITLDAGLDFNSSSIPGTQNGQQISFPLGTVGIGECGSFNLLVTPNCDDTALGETKCITAHITPDSICGSSNNWSGASIEARAECQGDSVVFTIQNVGNGPSSTLGYVIIDDHVVMMDGDFQLGAGESTTIPSLANGQTMRLTCDQEPGHPIAVMPSIGIEACGTGLPSQGFLTQFPNQTGSPFDATVCRIIIGSFDPNDKSATPDGVGEHHFIEKNTELEYLVNFQNTGTDTAINVIVMDTLSDLLDPLTITGLTGSHAPEVRLLSNNVLRFVMPNILLPDSTTNEAASHGFVRFKIQQKQDLVDGTLIKNKAAIYFDFNLPVITNEVFHEVGRDFLETASATHDGPSAEPGLVSLSPNPADDKSFVDVQALEITTGNCRLVDCYGRTVMEQIFDTPVFELKRNGLPAGLYFLEIHSDKLQPHGTTWASKVIWK